MIIGIFVLLIWRVVINEYGENAIILKLVKLKIIFRNMKKVLLSICLVLSVVVVLSFYTNVWAVGEPGNTGTPGDVGDTGGGSVTINLTTPISCTNFSCVFERIMNTLFWIAVPLTGIMVIIGAFQILTAAGNPEKFKSGKKTLLYAVIGFAVVLISGGVVPIIMSIFGGAT